MTTTHVPPDVGSILRRWRDRRRLTQLELALDAGISARHLSFVETGRSKPGRAMLLALADRLAIPYRERNEILLAAGYAPAFPERALDDSALAPVRDALDRILDAHNPYPGVAFDRRWNAVAANAAMGNLVAELGVHRSMLDQAPVNVLRLGFHPQGLAPRIANLGHWRAHFLGRLAQQIASTGDPELSALLEEVSAYPTGEDTADDASGDFLGPVRVRLPSGELWSFFGMFAGFDTPFEVTTSELALELLFPADEPTKAAFEKGAS